jgi:hypothetical protein
MFTRGDDYTEFIDDDFKITTSDGFATEIENAEEDFSTPLEATSTIVPTLYSIGTDLYLSTDVTFKMPLPNSYGMCEEVRSINFFENINSTRCARQTTYAACDSILDGGKYTDDLTFYSKTGSTIPVTVGTIWVVTDLDKSVDATQTAFQTTAVSTAAPDCTCTKVLKEVHYTAITTGGDEITSITADVVYVDLEAQTCTDVLNFEQIYSFTFKESEFSRSQSGSPGYAKGMPVLIGKPNTVDTNFIDANEDGFQLYGVDDSGTCLIETTDPIDPTAFYYSNPVLDFAENSFYGCKLSFTLAQLQTFCNGDDDQNIALFQNLVDNLQYAGIYGNSNPHFISDWVAVEYESTSVANPTLSGRKCTFDSAHTLTFYLTKLGTDDDPQLKISRAILSPVRLTWEHDLLDATEAKDFHILLSISFQEVPQSKSEFIPTPPNRLPKMNRNVLYPFFIFDDAWSATISMGAIALTILYFVFE